MRDLRDGWALITGLSAAALASLVDADPPTDVSRSEHAAWRTGARDRAICDAGARASDLLRAPGTGQGLQSLADELLCRQWLPYAAARAVFDRALQGAVCHD